MSENIQFIINASDLDFLIRNASITNEDGYRKYALPVMVHKEGSEALVFEMHRSPVLNANDYIKATVPQKGGISDGYHTFDELYEHRIVNFIAVCRLCKAFFRSFPEVWISKKHSDGSEWPGWFIMGIGSEPGEQISYHLPMSKWEECHKIASEWSHAPEWDGHTSADVLKRLAALYPKGGRAL